MNALARNNVTVQGVDGPVFLFAHGFGCDQTMWRHVAGQFRDRGRVVLFDHVGAGASDLSAYDPQKYASLDGYGRDVVEICEALALGPVVFVGHSVSATIGVLAAAARPDLFSRLILICASPRYANTDSYEGGFAAEDIEELLDLMDKNTLEWSGIMAPIVAGATAASTQTEWRDSVCRTDPDIAKAFARVTFTSDHRADYRRCVTPSLLIDSRDDALAPPSVGAYLLEAMPSCERVVLPTQGHCPHMTAPDQVIAAISDFCGTRGHVQAA